MKLISSECVQNVIYLCATEQVKYSMYHQNIEYYMTEYLSTSEKESLKSLPAINSYINIDKDVSMLILIKICKKIKHLLL